MPTTRNTRSRPSMITLSTVPGRTLWVLANISISTASSSRSGLGMRPESKRSPLIGGLPSSGIETI